MRPGAFSRQDHSKGFRGTDKARQPVGTAPARNYPDRCFGKAEFRAFAVGNNAVFRRESKLQASPEACPVNNADCREGKKSDPVQYLLAGPGLFKGILLADQGLYLPYIGSGYKYALFG